MSERIMTLHPEGKQGVNIEKVKYDVMRAAILSALESASGDDVSVSLQDIKQSVEQQLDGNFEGSVTWYFTTVKLDLEARGEIERISGRSPQHVRRVQ